METKTIAIGLIIGLLIGAVASYGVISSQTSILQNQINSMQTQINSQKAEVDKVPVLQQQVIALSNEKNALQIQSTTQQNQITTLQSQITTISGDKSRLQTQVNSLQTEINNKNVEITNLNAQIELLKTLSFPLPPVEGEPGSSRLNPANIGTQITTTFSYIFGSYTGTTTIKQVIRGTTAWSMIQSANMFNDPPDYGYEYVLVKIKWDYLSGTTASTSYDISGYDFDCYSGTGVSYDMPLVVEPSPALDATLYPGASTEGWVAYQVLKTDLTPVLVIGQNYDGTGGSWFKIYS